MTIYRRKLGLHFHFTYTWENYQNHRLLYSVELANREVPFYLNHSCLHAIKLNESSLWIWTYIFFSILDLMMTRFPNLLHWGIYRETELSKWHEEMNSENFIEFKSDIFDPICVSTTDSIDNNGCRIMPRVPTPRLPAPIWFPYGGGYQLCSLKTSKRRCSNGGSSSGRGMSPWNDTQVLG